MKRHPDAVERAEARVRDAIRAWAFAFASNHDSASELSAMNRALSALRRAYRDAACEAVWRCAVSSHEICSVGEARIEIRAAFARRRAS